MALPLLQYYCYIEITDRGHQELWQYYEKLAEKHGNAFALREIEDYADIYPVFRELFQRQADGQTHGHHYEHSAS